MKWDSLQHRPARACTGKAARTSCPRTASTKHHSCLTRWLLKVIIPWRSNRQWNVVSTIRATSELRFESVGWIRWAFGLIPCYQLERSAKWPNGKHLQQFFFCGFTPLICWHTVRLFETCHHHAPSTVYNCCCCRLSHFRKAFFPERRRDIISSKLTHGKLVWFYCCCCFWGLLNWYTKTSCWFEIDLVDFGIQLAQNSLKVVFNRFSFICFFFLHEWLIWAFSYINESLSLCRYTYRYILQLN